MADILRLKELILRANGEEERKKIRKQLNKIAPTGHLDNKPRVATVIQGAHVMNPIVVRPMHVDLTKSVGTQAMHPFDNPLFTVRKPKTVKTSKKEPKTVKTSKKEPKARVLKNFERPEAPDIIGTGATSLSADKYTEKTLRDIEKGKG